MRIITWNVRGINAPDKCRMLKRHLAKVSCEIADGRAGGLGILWKPSSVDISKMSEGKQWISCQVHCRLSQMELELWNIYGSNQSREKTLLWVEVAQAAAVNGNKKLIIGGDFNVILDLSEKSGGTKKITNDMLNFRNFVQKLEVVDCKPSVGWFT
ncbi:hypothetical protein SUGI_0166330 [Cryptomeria japonica]|nr:hypothetical protein SUGI_0166330 [Cryptomeria japonica]